MDSCSWIILAPANAVYLARARMLRTTPARWNNAAVLEVIYIPAAAANTIPYAPGLDNMDNACAAHGSLPHRCRLPALCRSAACLCYSNIYHAGSSGWSCLLDWRCLPPRLPLYAAGCACTPACCSTCDFTAWVFLPSLMHSLLVDYTCLLTCTKFTCLPGVHLLGLDHRWVPFSRCATAPPS